MSKFPKKNIFEAPSQLNDLILMNQTGYQFKYPKTVFASFTFTG